MQIPIFFDAINIEDELKGDLLSDRKGQLTKKKAIDRKGIKRSIKK
jgi:hypothetical protein